jgi:hypothetical protein
MFSTKENGMKSSDITKIITTLLTAPPRAVVDAASEQRASWIS